LPLALPLPLPLPLRLEEEDLIVIVDEDSCINVEQNCVVKRVLERVARLPVRLPLPLLVPLPLHLLLLPLLHLLPLLPLPCEEEDEVLDLIVAIDRLIEKIMILFHDFSCIEKKACTTERAVGILLGPESTIMLPC
jgi:hypothetical protein